MPTNVGLVLAKINPVTGKPQKIGDPIWIHAVSVTEGLRKELAKIPLPVGTRNQPGDEVVNPNPEDVKTDRKLVLDLLQITNDIQISGWITPYDIIDTNVTPNKKLGIEEIRNRLKSWMRTGALVLLDYRTNQTFNFGLRDIPGESWVVEDIQFDDDDIERDAFLSLHGELPDDWAGLRVNIKLLLCTLTKDRKKYISGG